MQGGRVLISRLLGGRFFTLNGRGMQGGRVLSRRLHCRWILSSRLQEGMEVILGRGMQGGRVLSSGLHFNGILISRLLGGRFFTLNGRGMQEAGFSKWAMDSLLGALGPPPCCTFRRKITPVASP